MVTKGGLLIFVQNIFLDNGDTTTRQGKIVVEKCKYTRRFIHEEVGMWSRRRKSEYNLLISNL